MLELALPWAGLGLRVDGAALVPGVLRDWRMLGEEDNPAEMVLFYFATEVGCIEKWNISAEPIPKLQMLKLMET